jgi:hypothetical protein
MSKRWLTEEALQRLPPGYKVREQGRAGAKPKVPAQPGQATTPPAVPPSAIATKAKPSSIERMQAKGRLAKGTMNDTETRYAAYLDQLKLAGEVLWWRFEPCKLLLAPQTSLTPDFMLLLADGALEMHDVKGAKAIYTDDAKVKMKIAAQEYPFAFRVVYPVPKSKGGGWDIELVRE